MRRELHVRFREGPGVKFPRATRLVIFGERHLRHLLKEFVGHYLTERYHQGLGSQIIRPMASPSNDNATLGAVRCRSRLGGALNYYCRTAA
jgi:putative transposase